MDDFDQAFNNMIRCESNNAKKDPKNLFRMNQIKQQPIILPLSEMKKRMPETVGVL